jgi:hypothetical protein
MFLLLSGMVAPTLAAKPVTLDQVSQLLIQARANPDAKLAGHHSSRPRVGWCLD